MASQPTSVKTMAPAAAASVTQVGCTMPCRSRVSPPSSVKHTRDVGGLPIMASGDFGAECPWVTMARSSSKHIDTVTGECQPSYRRDGERSIPSPSSSTVQQKSP